MSITGLSAGIVAELDDALHQVSAQISGSRSRYVTRTQQAGNVCNFFFAKDYRNNGHTVVHTAILET